MFHIKPKGFTEATLYLFILTIPFNTRIILHSVNIGKVFSYTQSFMFYLSDLLYLLVVGSYLFHVKPTRPSNKQLAQILILLGFWALLRAFHVEHLNLGLYQSLKWAEVLSLVWLIPRIVEHRINVLYILFIGALFQGLLGILQFHVQHMVGLRFLGEYIAGLGTPGLSTIDIGNIKLIRAYGTFPHPNVLGAFLLVGISSGLIIVSRETLKNLKTQLLVSCGTIVIIVSTFLTFSRIAWFGTSILLVGSLLIFLIKRDKKLIILVSALTIVSCGTIVSLYGNLLKVRTAELNSSSNSVVLRETFNDMGLKLWKSSQFTGIGTGNYIETMRERFELENWQYQPPHNVYIFILAELGLVGLGLFIGLLLKMARFTWNNLKTYEDYILSILLLTFLIISNFDHYFVTIQQGQLIFFLLLGLLLVRSNPNKELNVSSI